MGKASCGRRYVTRRSRENWPVERKWWKVTAAAVHRACSGYKYSERQNSFIKHEFFRLFHCVFSFFLKELVYWLFAELLISGQSHVENVRNQVFPVSHCVFNHIYQNQLHHVCWTASGARCSRWRLTPPTPLAPPTILTRFQSLHQSSGRPVSWGCSMLELLTQKHLQQ